MNDMRFFQSNSRLELKKEWTLAQNFLDSKDATQNPLKYALTVHNTAIRKDISHLFHNDQYGVKVSIEGEVIEWYKIFTPTQDSPIAFQSLDLSTGEILDTYVYDSTDPNKLIKTSNDLSLPKVVTVYGKWESIPEEIRQTLDYFQYKHMIYYWSNKSYGFILEYRKW